MSPITSDISGPGPGETTTGAANVPTTPTYVGHASGSVSFSFTENGNGSAVTYAIYVDEDAVDRGYLAADGSDNGATAIWQTFAVWGTTIKATGLTAPKSYRFKVKARNEVEDETAFSSWSAAMVPYIDLATGPLSSAASYECTTGYCKISGLTITGTSNEITLAYTLTRVHNVSTKNNVKIYYSTNGTDYTEIADAAITGAPATRQTLTASAAGTANSNVWATCTTLGNSYYGTIYVRVVPYDTATAGNAGDAAIATVSIDNRPLGITIAEFSAFTWDPDTTPEFVANMAQIICGSYMYFICRVYDSTGVEVQMNSCAENIAGWYYEQDHAGNPGSAIRHPEAGWDTNWTAVTTYGVPAAYLPPTLTGNRIRYILQTALTQGATYTVKMQAAEIVSKLV